MERWSALKFYARARRLALLGTLGAATDALQSAHREFERLVDAAGLGDQGGHVEGADEVSISAAGRVLALLGQVGFGALHVLLIHKSRAPHGLDDDTVVSGEPLHGERYPYSATVVLLCTNLLKFAYSAVAYVVVMQRSGKPDVLSRVSKDVGVLVGKPLRFLRMAIPAALYAVENSLRFMVLKELKSPVTWTIGMHTEIPIVALMHRFWLGRRLTTVQWVSVALVTNGVLQSQMAVCETMHGTRCDHLDDFQWEALLVVLFAALLSAMAGVTTEVLFKQELATSIHIQNMSLYFFGTLASLINLYVNEHELWKSGNWLRGFSLNTVLIIISISGMGLSVSVVVKHISNVAKVYASAGSIYVVTALTSIFEEAFNPSVPYLLGALEVISAVHIYYVASEEVRRSAGGSGLRICRVESNRDIVDLGNLLTSETEGLGGKVRRQRRGAGIAV